MVSINELVLALKRIQKVPGDTRLEHIISVLDDNEDGCVELEHVLQVNTPLLSLPLLLLAQFYLVVPLLD